MLDMLNVHAAGEEANESVYTQTDPAQKSLRSVLHGMTEWELADLEKDIDCFNLSGILTRKIEGILAAANQSFAQVA